MFTSYKEELQELLPSLVNNPESHAKWLNTLSFLENCGARKIASCQHPTKVKKTMLKHAAEESRHAFYLKDQIKRIVEVTPLDYSLESILGGTASLQYLNRLDLLVAKRLKSLGRDLHIAYILVTYAIEKRAEELYPIYMDILKETSSPITVKSILLEEEEHLAEMEEEIGQIFEGQQLAQEALAIENELFRTWLLALQNASRVQ